MYKLLLLFLGVILLFTKADAFGQYSRVTVVVDGERLVMENGSRVKLVGVDALEKFSRPFIEKEMLRLGIDSRSVRTKADISAAYLSILVGSKNVLISYQDDIHLDQKGNGGSEYRPAIVSVLDGSGALIYIVNKKMIEDGYALADTKSHFFYSNEFLRLEQQARNLKKGFWAYDDINTRKHLPLGKPVQSKDVDLSSECRSLRGCLWVSSGNGNVGFWQSVAGYTCPCEK